MSTKNDAVADLTEECERCGRATAHEVDVRILAESSNPENAAFSREPYRVSECQVCGHTETTRMNNA
jgi:ribosomal protein L37E